MVDLRHPTCLEPTAEIEGIMHRLRPPKWRDGHDEQQVSWMAEEYLDHLQPLEPAQPKGESLRQLSRLAQASEASIEAMMLLRGPAHGVLRAYLESDAPASGEIIDLLAKLAIAARKTHDVVDRAFPVRKGPQRREKPFEVAKLAAKHFRRLTGERPSRTNDMGDGRNHLDGAFSNFVAQMFDAMNINASVDDNAKRAIEWWTEENRL